MSIEEMFQIVEAIAVVVGVGFAMMQVRQYKRDKHREAALELLHAFQTPEFARALNIVYSMPDGLSKAEVEEYAGDEFHLVYAMTTTWESLGVLVHRGEIDLHLIHDFFMCLGESWKISSTANARKLAETRSTSGFSG